VASGSAVTATVYDDYSLEVLLPSDTATVSAASATINVMMQNVSSLDVNGTKSAKFEITTGLDGDNYKNIKLSEYLSSCYNFGGATIDINIGTKSCTYRFARDGLVITGTPTDIEATRAAWQTMIDGHITTSKGSGNSITIDNESLLVLGSSILMFEVNEDGGYTAGDLVLTTGTTKKNICDAVALYPLDEDYYTGPSIYAYLGADTALSVGNSCATLTQGVNITVDGVDLSKTYKGGGSNVDLNAVLTGLRTTVNGGNGSTAELILDLITAFDAVVNAVDVNNNVTVTLDFGASILG
jgi:hypothetical protein